MLQHLGAGLGVEGALRASALKERMRDEITAENGEIRLLREGESNEQIVVHNRRVVSRVPGSEGMHEPFQCTAISTETMAAAKSGS